MRIHQKLINDFYEESNNPGRKNWHRDLEAERMENRGSTELESKCRSQDSELVRDLIFPLPCPRKGTFGDVLGALQCG